MAKKYVIIGIAIALCLLLLSCQRVTPKASDAELVNLTNLPASYGNLISVTSIPAYPDWVQMWFQDNTGTSRVVRVSFSNNQMLSDVRAITRN